MDIRRTIELDPILSSEYADFIEHPYITRVNALKEYVVLYNPRNEFFSLDGYSLADGKAHHTFKFPPRCRIPPHTEYYIYTCPGADDFDHAALMEFHVLWTNHDGSLRKMEVLNNDHCSVKLIAPDDSTVSVCEGGVHPHVPEIVHEDNLRRSMLWKSMSKLQVGLVYVRIAVIFAMVVACVMHFPALFVGLFWVALICDLGSREVLHDNAALTTVALLGDRLHSLVLTGSLLFLLNNLSNLQADQSFGSATGVVSLGVLPWKPAAPPAAPLAGPFAPPSAAAAPSKFSWMFFGLLSGVPGFTLWTAWTTLLLEFGAVLLNMHALLCPSDTEIVPPFEGVNEGEGGVGQNGAPRMHQPSPAVHDIYAQIQQSSPFLLTILTIAAEYYQLHCYVSYYYRLDPFLGNAYLSPRWMNYLYKLLALSAVTGWGAYILKMANNGTLIGLGLTSLVQKREN